MIPLKATQPRGGVDMQIGLVWNYHNVRGSGDGTAVVLVPSQLGQALFQRIYNGRQVSIETRGSLLLSNSDWVKINTQTTGILLAQSLQRVREEDHYSYL